jgi:hypothetical protein
LGYKRIIHLHVLGSIESNVLFGKSDTKGKTWTIVVGPVLEKGTTVPSRKDLANYIDILDFFNSAKFMQDQLKYFSTCWVLL